MAGSAGKGVICNPGGDAFAYLGHFRNPKFLRQGHNDGGEQTWGNYFSQAPHSSQSGGTSVGEGIQAAQAIIPLVAALL